MGIYSNINKKQPKETRGKREEKEGVGGQVTSQETTKAQILMLNQSILRGKAANGSTILAVKGLHCCFQSPPLPYT